MSLRKLLASLLVVSMVLGLVGGSALAAEAEQWDQAVAPLVKFGVVRGDAQGLRLNDPITRAEMVTVLVRAKKGEDMANLLKGAPSFRDVAPDAWYSGYVAYAKNSGITNGYPDGTFRPSAKVTYAEAVAFLVKLLGLQPVAGAEWPNNYIQAFEKAGLAVEGLNLTEFANAPALRGWVFALADSAFKYGGADSVYARLDGQPPVLTVDPVNATTEAPKITVTGKVSGAVKVLVNDTEVAVGADGSFSAEVELKVGTNSIVVKAVDDVGLVTQKTIEITRTNTAADKIVVAPNPIEVVAGQTVDVTVKVLDKNGAEIADAAAQVTGESTLGTFQAGKFTAGQKAGTGTLTLKYGEITATVNVVVKPGDLTKLEVIPSTQSAAPGELVTFTVKGLDAFGNQVSGITPIFSVDGAGVLINPTTGDFIASKPGKYTVTAKVGEITGSAVVGVYGDVAGVKIEGPATLVANGESEAVLTVKLVDKEGNVVKLDDKTVEIDFPADIITVNGKSTSPVSVKLVDGQATLKVKSVEDRGAGAIADIKATYQNGDDTLETTASVELLEQVATGIVFNASGSDKYLVANSEDEESVVRFTIVDQEGKRMLSGSWDVRVSIGENDPAVLVEDVVGSDAGTVNVTLRSLKGETGTVTVTATVEGLGSATGTIQAAIAKDPYKLVADVISDGATVSDQGTDNLNKVKFTVVDKAGVPVKGDYDIKVEFSDKVDIFHDNDQPVTDDEYTLHIEGATSGTIGIRSTQAKAFDITATVVKVGTEDVSAYKDLASSKATAKVSFVPGPVDHVKFAVADNSDGSEHLPVLFSPDKNKATLKVQLEDEFNNPVQEAGHKVTVTETQGKVLLNGKTKDVDLVTGADGTATVDVEVRPYIDTYTLELKREESTVNDDSVTLKVLPTLPETVTLTLKAEGTDKDGKPTYNPFSSTKAGTTIRVEVQLKDRYGEPLPDKYVQDNGLLDHLKLDVADGIFGNVESDKPQDANLIDQNWQYENGVYYLELKAFKAGRQTIGVQFANLLGEAKTVSRSFTVNAGDPDHAIIAEADGNKITVKANEVKPLTLQIVDKWDNVTNEYKKVTIDISDSDLAHIRSAKDGTQIHELQFRGSKTIYLVTSSKFDDKAAVTVRFTLDGGDYRDYELQLPQ